MLLFWFHEKIFLLIFWFHEIFLVKETSGDDATKQDDPGTDTIGNRITDVTKFKAGHPLKSISLPFIELDTLKRKPNEKQGQEP